MPLAKRAWAGLSAALLAGAIGCGGSGAGDHPRLELDQLQPRESVAPATEAAGQVREPGGGAGEGEPQAETRTETVRVGRSVEGRPITATVVSGPPVSANIIVIGCIHGDEPAGMAVTERLAGLDPPRGTALWLVDEFNPDGCAAGTRQNANGVDLNRNSPWRWRPLESPGDTYYSGTGPLSEPESRAINALVTEIEPLITIWYHQHAALVDRSGGDPAIERRYAELVGLPHEWFGRFPGSITSWQNETYPADTAFVVELPAGALSEEDAATHAGAVIQLTSEILRNEILG